MTTSGRCVQRSSCAVEAETSVKPPNASRASSVRIRNWAGLLAETWIPSDHCPIKRIDNSAVALHPFRIDASNGELTNVGGRIRVLDKPVENAQSHGPIALFKLATLPNARSNRSSQRVGMRIRAHLGPSIRPSTGQLLRALSKRAPLLGTPRATRYRVGAFQDEPNGNRLRPCTSPVAFFPKNRVSPGACTP